MTRPYGLDAAALAQSARYGAALVRPVKREDQAVWTRLWTGYLTFYETALPPEQFALSFARLFDPAEPVAAFLAEHEGVARGLVHIVFHRSFWMEGPSCYLQDLYVDPELRGAQLGKALIEHVYVTARAAGAKRVHWLTHESNTYAMRLYDRIAERSGFVQYRKAL